MKVGDYVYDWELGLLGLIVDKLPCDSFVLLGEDGEMFEAFENALSTPIDQCAQEGAPSRGVPPSRGPHPEP
jgi:hypothetical protein